MAGATHYIRGVANWAKIVGKPVPNYGKDGFEWTIDVTPDAAGLKLLKQLKLGNKLKDKDDERKEFIQFKQKSQRKDRKTGEMVDNYPPTIVDKDGQDWPADMKIGNGSKVDVKFNIVPYDTTTGIYLQGVRVLDLVPYEGGGGGGFAPLDEDDEFFARPEPVKTEKKPAKKAAAFGDDLEDDLPF